MAELAIKGHKERGKEVIALLEMLGGKNESLIPYDGRDTDSFYRITDDGCIVSSRFAPTKKGVKYQTYTLEEFEKEFPYKVGDEVRLGIPDEVRITNMYWDPCSDQVIYEVLSVNGGREYDNLHAKQLSPCKEKPSPDKAKAPALEGQDCSEGRIGYRIPEGFELDKIEDGEIILKPKKKVLPKTYGKCCEVLGFSSEGDIVYSGNWVYGGSYLEQQLKVLRSFSKLLICRDAYWKLAGDWKPDWTDHTEKFVIQYVDWHLCTNGKAMEYSEVLAFPTAEMRGAFYDNFKNLIWKCKELL